MCYAALLDAAQPVVYKFLKSHSAYPLLLMV